MKKLSLSVAILLVLLQTGWAQGSGEGSIYGTVADASGAVIPGADVTVVNDLTGLTRNTTTDDNGSFRVDFLRPGEYRLEIRKQGFETAKLTNIKLLVGQIRKVDSALNVGSISSEVTVSQEGVALNTTNGTRGDVIEKNEISNLPLNGREFLPLATLVPGAYSGTRPLDVPVGAKGNFVAGYNGARGNQNSFYLDGGVNTSPQANNMISSPSVEAIQEFRVQTDQYAARYGQAAGGIISVITKSGTNAFHGSLYEYHRDKALDALPFFYTGTRKDLPNRLWNQFGGSIGGPVWAPIFGEGGPSWWKGKDKLFFFFNAEFFPQLASQEKIGFAPTAAERVGDVRNSINPWSGQPVVLTDPHTGEIIPSGILPDSLKSPVGIALMNLWPEPNYPQNPAFNYRVFRPVRNSVHKYLLRIDANFSSNNSLAGTLNWGNSDQGVAGFIDYGDKIQTDHDRTVTTHFTHIFSPSFVSITGFTFNQDFYGDRYRLAEKNYGVELGMDPSVNKNPGMPWILLFTQGSQFFTFGAAGDNKNFTRQGQIYEDMSWQRGRHTLQFGGLFWRQNYKWQFFSGSSQYFVNLIDGIAPGTWPLFGVTGSAFTNLLAGLYNLGVFGAGGGEYAHFQRDTYALYAQDDWRVSRRLTLNLGLRWDYERPFKVLDKKFLSLNEQNGLIKYTQGAPGISAMQIPYESDGSDLTYRSHPLVLDPRVGFAWQPFSSGDTVLRGGYGIFHTSELATSIQAASFANPFGGPTTVWQKGILGGFPDGDHLDGFSNPPFGLDSARRRHPGCCFVYTDTKYPRSYMQHWNLTVSHKLPAKVIGEIAYVGGRGVNLSGYTPLSSYNTDAYNKFVVNYGPSVKPPVRVKGFNSIYNALQVHARRNQGHGLTFLAAYTWSHAIADSSNDNVTENLNNELLNGGVDNWHRFRANAGFDVRHRFSLSTIYELPWGRGRRIGSNWSKVVDTALGGWDLSAIYTYQTGFPFSVRSTAQTIPDRICDGNLPKSERSLQRWFDYTCFPTHINPVTGQPSDGNAGANQIYGPGINNWDMGIHKRFMLKETMNIELRLEAFNIWNHPQFRGPVSGNWFNNTKESAEIGTARDQRQVQLAVRFDF